MFIQELISPEIPALSLGDHADKALQLMQDLHLSHLPLVDGTEYKSLIHEDDLLEWDNPDVLAQAPFLVPGPVVYGHLHPYEAIRRATQMDISLVPVIDKDEQYQGVVTRYSLLDYMSQHSGLDKPGGIIILEMRPVDYSLSEIARICENNDVIILNLQIFTQPESDMMRVVIKTNTREVQTLVASFERYEYNVRQVFGELPAQESMKERYESLMRYINMGT